MKELIRERESAPPLRPGQLQALQLPARERFSLAPGMQMRSANALQRAHGAERIAKVQRDGLHLAAKAPARQRVRHLVIR